MMQRYAIVDIETTGGKASRDKITEIGIVLHDGEKIIDTFETLINPECYIPFGITQLTGITQEMVADAPKFYEVARQIVEWTEGAIFVAHNVRFDYHFLREEFARLGFTFSRRQLCTVRLSRQTFPGLPSYSLDSLIRHFSIPIENRHRAMGDALATTHLLERILAQSQSEKQIREMVNLGVKESRLPSNFSIERIHELPEECGVYYFHNEAGDVVYVGKSINIRKRVAEHFADPTEKARVLQQHAHDVTFELTGSELIALLLESHEIKRLRPPVNRTQRLHHFPYVVYTWTDENGYRCFGFSKVSARDRRQMKVLAEYPTLTSARSALSRATETFQLCPRLAGIQNGKGACFHYHLHQCAGACIGEEPASHYNERAEEALERLRTVFDQDFFLLDRGRSNGEYAVVQVSNGKYRGFGFVDKDQLNGSVEDLQDAVRPFTPTPETTRIILRFLARNPKAKIFFPGPDGGLL